MPLPIALIFLISLSISSRAQIISPTPPRPSPISPNGAILAGGCRHHRFVNTPPTSYSLTEHRCPLNNSPSSPVRRHLPCLQSRSRAPHSRSCFARDPTPPLSSTTASRGALGWIGEKKLSVGLWVEFSDPIQFKKFGFKLIGSDPDTRPEPDPLASIVSLLVHPNPTGSSRVRQTS